MGVTAFRIHLVIYSEDILFTSGGGFHLVAMTTHIFLPTSCVHYTESPIDVL